MISNKLCNIFSLYGVPNQNSEEFLNFINNNHKNWCSDDRPAEEGCKINNVASQFLLSQIIKEPIQISESSSSCMYLIFTNQPNLVIDLGVAALKLPSSNSLSKI